MTFDPIGLGDRVKDPVSGYTGIVTGITTWLHGCVRMGVMSETLHEGKPIDERWFDQSQLRLVERGVHTPLTLGVVESPAAPPIRSPGGPAREGGNFRRG
jgi:hypothetical protein